MAPKLRYGYAGTNVGSPDTKEKKPRDSKVVESGRKREDKRNLLEGEDQCKVRFRVTVYTKHADTEEEHRAGLGNCRCVPEWFYVARNQSSLKFEHNHTLESQDKYKRSDGILHFAQVKVEEGGYLYAAVRRWMKDKYAARTKQVEFLSDGDVANASRKWRVHHRDLELIETIEESTPEEEQRKRCLDLIQNANADGLKKALLEICSRIPDAVGIALPFIEAAQESRNDTEQEDKIAEGDDIVIPEPGLPVKTANGVYNTSTHMMIKTTYPADPNGFVGQPSAHPKELGNAMSPHRCPVHFSQNSTYLTVEHLRVRLIVVIRSSLVGIAIMCLLRIRRQRPKIIHSRRKVVQMRVSVLRKAGRVGQHLTSLVRLTRGKRRKLVEVHRKSLMRRE